MSERIETWTCSVCGATGKGGADKLDAHFKERKHPNRIYAGNISSIPADWLKKVLK